MSVFVLSGDDADARERRVRSIEYQRELNQEQLDVVLHGDGPCLVLAGAGSGKTRTVTYRVAYLLEQGVHPSQILLLTFTNKAAREMMGRVAELIGPAAQGVWGGTFHSTANRILRSTASSLGYSSRFTILDQSDAESLIKAVMKELSIDPKARRFPTASVVHSILSFSTNTQTSVADALEMKYPNFFPFANDIEEIGRRYAIRKRQANAMDFDDLLVNWHALMRDAGVGPRLATQFRYVLVDEYQDVNALQAGIVHAMGSAHRNVLVVGDDAQSIYAFRGADVKNILSFPNDWPGATIYKLLTNYRSAPEILELANESLSKNERQYKKELVGVKPKSRKPILVAAASAKQEAKYVAEMILGLRAEGVALGNMAVLFRSSAHSQSLEFELLQKDIPYDYRGGMKFFERAHVKDALSYLRIAANPRDEAAWLRALNLHQGIGATTALHIQKTTAQLTDIEAALSSDFAIHLPVRARAGWEEFAELMRRVLREGPKPSVMLRAILAGGYRDMLEREYPDWNDRLDDLEQLVTFAGTYAEPAAFLSDVALTEEYATGRSQAGSGRGRGDDGSGERIVLSTIHQAKGLEWDTIFVIHTADGSFPSRRAMSETDGIEEERRLFYVAVTRSRRHLFISYPIVGGYDAMTLNQPSLFIEEVHPRLFERMELREQSSARNNEQRAMNNRLGIGEGDEWSWEEPSIDVNETRSRSRTTGGATIVPSASVWKSSKKSTDPPRTSFLRDVSEL